MRRGLFRTAAAFLATVLFSYSCMAAPALSAQSGILIDADSGAVYYSHNADARSLIASTTKIMTAVVVLEHCPLDMVYTIPPEATGIEGSSIYLKAGERMTIRELLYGLMLHSGNDAAVALALACSDSVPEFVDLMNLKAQQLSLSDTHFDNPNGLDSETHYSTASDLALLTRYALQNPDFRAIVSTKSIRLGARSLTNHNKLLWQVQGAIGVKTGYTRAAGRVLVSAAEREGRRLIAVTINDGNDWRDHAALYDYGFANYRQTVAFSRGEPVASISLMDGTTARLLAADDVTCCLAGNETLRVQVLYPRVAFSAGAEGSFAGTAALYVGENQLTVFRLLWGDLEEEHERTNTEAPVGARRGLPAER